MTLTQGHIPSFILSHFCTVSSKYGSLRSSYTFKIVSIVLSSLYFSYTWDSGTRPETEAQ